jgi:YfiH family protein
MPIILVADMMTRSLAERTLPQPSGDFEWVQAAWGAALRCRPLVDIAPHVFSTRDLRLDGVGDNDPESWRLLSRDLGVELDALVRLRQVHCVEVFAAKKRAKNGQSGKTLPTPFSGSPVSGWPQADIAVSDDPSVALSVRIADCVPILLADRRGGAVAAIHAGWNGTAEGAAMVAVRALESRFGTRPADVVAAVGPSIGPCCYEFGSDLVERFSAHADASSWFANRDKPHLDLWRATRSQLERAGVPASQIHVAALCTFDHPALFHSYRRDGKQAGRLVAAIRSAPGTTL